MNTYSDRDIAKIFIEDDVVQVVFEPNVVLSLECAQKMIKHRLEITAFKDHLLYVDIRSLLSVDERTRKYLSGFEGTRSAIAAGVHIGNPISKFLGNLFIKVDKPEKPIRLFTDKTEAINWLKKMK